MKITLPIKKIFISAAFLVALAVVLESCKPDDGVSDKTFTPKEQALRELTGIWLLQSLQIDRVITTDFAGLSLMIDDSTITAYEGGTVWPSVSTWSFTDDAAKAIKRGDEIIINIDQIDDTIMTLSFTVALTTGVNVVAGKYVFIFHKLPS
jgi:hypothetical protein